MKSAIYILITTILCYSAVTEATRCPVCGYAKGIPDSVIGEDLKPFLDESCKTGNTPNNKFLQTCEPYDDPFDKTELGCATGSFKATLPEMEIAEEAELTVRGCFPLVADGCQAFTKNDLLIPELPDEVLEIIKALPDDLTAEICVAKGTEGGQGDNSDNASSFVKMNTVLWVFPVLCFLSKLVR